MMIRTVTPGLSFTTVGTRFGHLYRPGLLGRLTMPSVTIILPNLKNILEEMILRAAPKKKPSYRKTRQKLYAPGDKKIQVMENIVRCPACGAVKRSHFMCMNCFGEIKTFLKSLKPKPNQPEVEINKVDEQIIYPGKRLNEDQKRLMKKDWIPVREKPLMFNYKQVKPRK